MSTSNATGTPADYTSGGGGYSNGGGGSGSFGGGSGGAGIRETPVSDVEFRLDTKNFNTLIEKSKKLAEMMRDLKHELDNEKNNLLETWVGEGSETFQTKYRQLTQQLSDLGDELFEISDKVAYDYEQYMLWDTEISKNLDGKDSRY